MMVSNRNLRDSRGLFSGDMLVSGRVSIGINNANNFLFQELYAEIRGLILLHCLEKKLTNDNIGTSTMNEDVPSLKLTARP